MLSQGSSTRKNDTVIKANLIFRPTLWPLTKFLYIAKQKKHRIINHIHESIKKKQGNRPIVLVDRGLITSDQD